MVPEFGGNERTDRIGDLYDRHIRRVFDFVECGDEETTVFLDSSYAFGNDWPGVVNTFLDCAGDFVFARLACHFGVGRHRKERLRREKRLEALGKELLSR